MSPASKTVLMCGSSLDYQGGMTTVVKNYLSWSDWGEFGIDFVPTHVSGGKIKVAMHFALTLPKIEARLHSGEVDLVHLHTAERGSFWRKALIAERAQKHGIPVVLHHHAAEFEQFYASLDQKGKDRARRVVESADLNIALSESVKQTLLGHFPGARFEVLYNAVPSYADNAYDPFNKNVVFMGRIGQRKGAYDLIQAFASIVDAIDSEVRLVLCGDGEVEKARNLIAELGLMDRAECRGWVGADERASVLRSAMVNVLPSYNEGLPMSILEAMSFGVPTISTAIASIPEVITEGETGALVQPGDVAALAAKLRSLLADASLRSRISANSFALVDERFSLGPHIERLKEMYRTLC